VDDMSRFALVLLRPGMYGIHDLEQGIAFVGGFDAACDHEFLDGFREWPAGQGVGGPNLAWAALVRLLIARRGCGPEDELAEFLAVVREFLDSRAGGAPPAEGLAVELADLSRLPSQEAFDWWEGGGRLAEGAGPNAWLGVVQLLTGPLVVKLADPVGERLSAVECQRRLRVVDEVFSYVVKRALMSPHEALTRRLSIAAVLARSGIPLPDSSFAADRMVREVIALVTPERLAEASLLGPMWTALERPEILRLLQLKHLIRLALDLREHLGDDEAAAAVDSWLPVYEVLPRAGS
jgi:hypothetical protein